MRMLSMNNGMKAQRGVSLVEVMVAMLVTTAGLLGFAGLQTRALTATEDAYLRVQAMSIAQDLIERARISNVVGPVQSFAVNNANYIDPNKWSAALPPNIPGGTTCYPSSISAFMGGGCTASTMIERDVYQLRLRASQTLPNGSVWAEACTNGRMCIFVAWGSMTAENCKTSYFAASSASVPNECTVVEGV